MNVTLISLTVVNILISGATLVVVLVVGKKAKDEVELIKVKANIAVVQAGNALDSLQF